MPSMSIIYYLTIWEVSFWGENLVFPGHEQKSLWKQPFCLFYPQFNSFFLCLHFRVNGVLGTPSKVYWLNVLKLNVYSVDLLSYLPKIFVLIDGLPSRFEEKFLSGLLSCLNLSMVG